MVTGDVGRRDCGDSQRVALIRRDLRLAVICAVHDLVSSCFRFAVDGLGFLDEGEICHVGWVRDRIEDVLTVFFLRFVACHGVLPHYRVSGVVKVVSRCTRRMILFGAEGLACGAVTELCCVVAFEVCVSGAGDSSSHEEAAGIFWDRELLTRVPVIPPWGRRFLCD